MEGVVTWTPHPSLQAHTSSMSCVLVASYSIYNSATYAKTKDDCKLILEEVR